MYRAFENVNGFYYVAWEDAQGFHGQPGVWTAQNQYRTLEEAQREATWRNRAAAREHAPVKIVDTFNGWEGDTYPSREAAESALAAMEQDYYARPGTQHDVWCKAIVPVTWTWYWDQRQNTYVWGP